MTIIKLTFAFACRVNSYKNMCVTVCRTMNLGIVKSKLPNAKGPYYPRSVPRQGFVRGLDYDLP